MLSGKPLVLSGKPLVLSGKPLVGRAGVWESESSCWCYVGACVGERITAGQIMILKIVATQIGTIFVEAADR